MKRHYFIVFALLSFTIQAQIVNIPDANFKTELLNYVPVIDANGDNEIQASEALTVTQLFTTSVNISDLTGIEAFTNLTFLNVAGNNLTTVNLNGLVNLTGFNGDYNQLTSVIFGDADNLATFSVIFNELTTLDLSGKIIDNIFCDNNLLTSINLDNAAIQEIRCSNNQLTQLDLSDLVQLNELHCTNNQLTSIDFSANEFLSTVYCTLNPITQLDFSQNPFMFETDCFNPLLQSINLKNGAVGTVSLAIFADSSSLRFVCVDTEDIAYFENFFEMFDMPLVNVSSYCSFSPGGKYNTIAGSVRYDADGDGCDITDSVLPNVRIDINDSLSGSGSVFTDAFGKYRLFTSIGTFQVVPENSFNFYTLTPPTASITFLNDNHNVTLQDFCLTPNGVHQDLEITIVPTEPPRPGFNATYLLSYKNKGTIMMSGSVNLQFQDDMMDLVSAVPTTTQTVNNLDWTFTDLIPFETRTVTVVMNINSPVEAPPVNIGDQLAFQATVFPTIGDEIPDDNIASLSQIVVGSFDPNDITCLEGPTIAVEEVGDYLHYVIRFQNSGTFYAENVVVTDIIDAAKFDISTFALTSSSHSHETRIFGDNIEFIFEGINLPAEQDDEPGSHGYIAFKVKTRNSLVLEDSVSQSASIFFDFNFPIITNTAVTTVSALGVRQFNGSEVAVFPNPVKSIVTVSSGELIKAVKLYDLQGRLLDDVPASSDRLELDMSNRNIGIYILRIETAGGINTERLIKE